MANDLLLIYLTYFMAMQFDAFQQAIRHFGLWRDPRWDYAWHFIYWLFTIPSFSVCGYVTINYLVANWAWFYDFWHFRGEHFLFAGAFVIGIIGWQVSYKLIWKKIFWEK